MSSGQVGSLDVEMVVDLQRVTVVLAEADDTGRFAVRVASPDEASPHSTADVHRLGDVLAAAKVGHMAESGEAFIRPEAVRFHAEGQVGEGWDERFAGMCDFAASKGWIDPGGSIQAHVEWPRGA
jgi:hypothetical protein